MSKVAELERQLMEVKRVEAAKEREAMCKPFVDQLQGRAFLYRHKSRNWHGIQHTLGFQKFGKPEVKFQGDRLVVEIPIKRVWAQTASRVGYVGDQMGRQDTKETHTHIHDLSRAIVKEVSIGIFRKAWEQPAKLAELMQQRWLALSKTEDLELYEEPKPGELDAPHISLEGMESSIVGDCVFRIGNAYLLTPNSIKYALDQMREDEEIDQRCSHLYEECDMRHVTASRAARAALRTKLKLP